MVTGRMADGVGVCRSSSPLS